MIIGLIGPCQSTNLAPSTHKHHKCCAAEKNVICTKSQGNISQQLFKLYIWWFFMVESPSKKVLVPFFTGEIIGNRAFYNERWI